MHCATPAVQYKEHANRVNFMGSFGNFELEFSKNLTQ